MGSRGDETQKPEKAESDGGIRVEVRVEVGVGGF